MAKYVIETTLDSEKHFMRLVKPRGAKSFPAWVVDQQNAERFDTEETAKDFADLHTTLSFEIIPVVK